jgi:hypothetical protein
MMPVGDRWRPQFPACSGTHVARARASVKDANSRLWRRRVAVCLGASSRIMGLWTCVEAWSRP